MRIVLLTNAASGKGGSHSLASRAADALARAGHDVQPVPLAHGWETQLAGAALVIACGGDGTVSAAASAIAASTNDPAQRTALYHLPRGTENLFAREFGMQPDIDQLTKAVHQWRIQPVDLGTCAAPAQTPSTFALMCSVGFDADVLSALAARRKGPISHRSYTRPVIECLLRPTIRTLTIEVDGRTIVERVKGNAIISNCGRYALGIDPSRDASMTDGQLDLFFAPSASSARTLVWMGLALARMGCNARSIIRAKGSRITIRTADNPAPDTHHTTRFQTDGEAMTARGTTLELGVRAGVLPVLLAPRD